MTVVGLDDFLHETMSNDVSLIEVDKFDTRNTVKNLPYFDQPRDPIRGQINLRNITRDDGFRVKTQTRKEHLHLFGSGVLRLIQNHKRVVERTAAHERERSDFDISPIDEPVGPLHIHHIE